MVVCTQSERLKGWGKKEADCIDGFSLKQNYSVQTEHLVNLERIADLSSKTTHSINSRYLFVGAERISSKGASVFLEFSSHRDTYTE